MSAGRGSSALSETKDPDLDPAGSGGGFSNTSLPPVGRASNMIDQGRAATGSTNTSENTGAVIAPPDYRVPADFTTLGNLGRFTLWLRVYGLWYDQDEGTALFCGLRMQSDEGWMLWVLTLRLIHSAVFAMAFTLDNNVRNPPGDWAQKGSASGLVIFSWDVFLEALIGFFIITSLFFHIIAMLIRMPRDKAEELYEDLTDKTKNDALAALIFGDTPFLPGGILGEGDQTKDSVLSRRSFIVNALGGDHPALHSDQDLDQPSASGELNQTRTSGQGVARFESDGGVNSIRRPLINGIDHEDELDEGSNGRSKPRSSSVVDAAKSWVDKFAAKFMKVALLTSQKDMAECGKTLNVMTSSCALVIVCGSVVLAVHQKSTLCGYCSDDDDYCSSVCEKYHQDGLSWLMLAYFILLKTLWVGQTLAHAWIMVCVFVCVLILCGRLCSRFVDWCRSQVVHFVLDKDLGPDSMSLDFIVREHDLLIGGVVNDLLTTVGYIVTFALMCIVPASLLCFQSAFHYSNEDGPHGTFPFVRMICTATLAAIFLMFILYAAGRFSKGHADSLSAMLLQLRGELPCRGEHGWRTKYTQLREDIESILSYLSTKPFGFFIGGTVLTQEKAVSFAYFFVYLVYYVWSLEDSPNPFAGHTDDDASDDGCTCALTPRP